MERPIFYAMAVIIAGYLPIYVLTGPSGRLFQPMAIPCRSRCSASLLCALTLLPVLCAYFLRKRVHEPELRFYERMRGHLRQHAWLVPAQPGCHGGCCASLYLRRSLLLIPIIGGRVHAAP